MIDSFEQSLQLVGAAKRGDRDALNRLFTRYYDRVRSIVRARMGARLRLTMDSGDLSQDTFLTAMKLWDRFEVRNEASLINWLARLAENQITDAADRVKAKKRDVDRQSPLDTNADLHPIGRMTAPLDKLAKSDQQEQLMTALHGMEPDLRELILLRDFAGASWEEVAAELEKPSPDAARMAYGKAKTVLAKKLLAAGFDNTDRLLGEATAGA